jgi:hypothetical protein
MGRTDASNHPTTAKFAFSINGQAASLPSGATVQCRTYPINGTVPSYATCTPDSNGNLSLSFDASKPIGRYKTEARLSYQGSTSDAASVTYYVHNALDGASLCTSSVTDAAYFSAAAAVLPMGATFGSGTNLNAPFNEIKFDSAAAYPSFDAKVASLRKRFVKNASNNLILLKRKYTRMGNNNPASSCSPMWYWQRGNGQQPYDVVVFDAKGNWVGFMNHTAVVAGTGTNAAARFREHWEGPSSPSYAAHSHKPFHAYTTDMTDWRLFNDPYNANAYQYNIFFLADE